MRIRQAEQQSMELRSGRWTVLAFGLPFAVIPILFITGSQGLVSSGPGASAPVQGMLWAFLTPVILFVLVILGVIAGLYTRRHTLLRWDGPSTAQFSRPALLRKQQESFDLRQVHHLLLHTDRKSRHSHDGGGATTLTSTLYAVLRDGREMVLGTSRQIGTFGNQPGLSQAQQVSAFIDRPLERTGYRAGPA